MEVNNWVDPPVAGTPPQDPTAVGLHAVGFSVPDLDATVSRLKGLGCTVVGSAPSPFGDAWISLRDPWGVVIDLLGDTSVPADTTKMRHLRGTVGGMATSLKWYEGLGYQVVAKADVTDGSFLGIGGGVRGQAVRLRVPDDPFEALLVYWDTPASHGRHYVEPNHFGLYRIALCVDDTRAAYDQILSAGWTFDRPPDSVELEGTPVPDMWICFLRDPDGVLYEFVERPRLAFRKS